MEAVRTCSSCRQRAPRSSLVRLVARDGRVVVMPRLDFPAGERGSTPLPDASPPSPPTRPGRPAGHRCTRCLLNHDVRSSSPRRTG
jgi:hypothetical protein